MFISSAPSQRELHQDDGGGGGGVAMRARAARPPKQVLRHVLCHVLRNALRCVLHELVIHVT